MTIRRTLLAALAGLAVSPSRAQARYPDHAVRLVVPFPPGGLNDTVARLLSEALASDWKQAVVVDNRPGAAGLIGTRMVADAPADGYTLLLTSTSNHVLAPLTQSGARVDPQHELEPVALVLHTVGVLVVPSGLPVHGLAEFVALARSQPGKLNYASSGIGSANHVLGERFCTLAGIDLVHVPYRGGSQLMGALMAGESQFSVMDFASVDSALRSGKVRALAQSGVTRHIALPGVPTLAEVGFKDFDPSFWIGIAAPGHTPLAAVAWVNASIDRALAQPAFSARAQALGWTLGGGPPAVLAQTIADDIAAYRPVVAALHLDRQ